MAPVLLAAAEACARGLAETLGPLVDGLVAAHAAQRGGGGQGPDHRQPMPAAMGAARIRDVQEVLWQGTHLFGIEHESRPVVQGQGGPVGVAQSLLHSPAERAHKGPLGLFGLGRIAGTGAAVAAGEAQFQPVGGPEDTPVKAAGINKGLQEPERMAEALLPVGRNAALHQRQHPRAEVGSAPFRENQEPAVVGKQRQAVVLGTEVPANLAIPRRALQRRCGLVWLLEDKFGVAAAQRYRRQVEQADETALWRWSLRILKAETVEEVFSEDGAED